MVDRADDFFETLHGLVREISTDAMADRVIDQVRARHSGEEIYIKKGRKTKKAEIKTEWEHGVPVPDICRRHGVSRGWVYRVVRGC